MRKISLWCIIRSIVEAAISKSAKIEARFRVMFSPIDREKYDEKKSTDARKTISVRKPSKGRYKKSTTIKSPPNAPMPVEIGNVNISCSAKIMQVPIINNKPVAFFEIIERCESCIKIIYFNLNC